MSYEVEIKGVTYESVPEPDSSDHCKGCAASSDEYLCEKLGSTCGNHHIIWIKKEKPVETTEQTEEPKYSVEEVMEAIENVTGLQCWHDIDEIKEYLALQNNPEYKLYLELKAKFGE